ncbi:bifunctional 4-hydroxy-2-oxoglutarate aldolase/2-dehydro-3-deoxy-phosphogluconate aldolase [Flavobacterium zepuense]|uniref:Bifunctional 4-hydroxy-2-oxoglutarate aldolase/2-dehydro-3-deoxy-phosphogluconate aldolase n=1 Tax=Flavobacterium zepuense TaxID=2593302 RepID=A0A552V077_9FLAO|nr:bifunctional 4-hydroxy-2-oxoglutarate aldolase/2-dehydro-3-deoxy-phosphogluconate aldolase [Flavobacterium zepuense]TRW23878.1 bifunctional 4-hydroxy-2-oxoglutarate aldolase/2-dehydro-3-deoxy-phosphogluconate aldolase [Flavobacterium zepuense]
MSDKIVDIINSIKGQGMLPLYFNPDESTSVEVLRALYAAGIRAVEYTNRGDEAFANFKAMLAIRDSEMAGLYLGIGTLKTAGDANKYIAAGADFLISPGFVPEISAIANKNNMLYVPGCMTPSEIIAAENSGVQFIKLFPGNVLGPKFMGSIRDVFPKLLFMPTGGVEPVAESIAAWMNAGVCAVGMGSKLITKDLMKNNDFKGLEATTHKLLQTIQRVRE